MTSTPTAPPSREQVLRETVETLACLERTPCSEGERRAAEWLAERLRHAGAEAAIEPASAVTGYARTIGSLCAAGAIAGIAGASGRRRSAAAIGLAAAALIADDASNGARPWRRIVDSERPTQNVVAQVGPDDAARTLVVLAHHDAAPTGYAFDPTLQRLLAERFPDLIARLDTSLPIWWPVAAGSALAALGGLTGRRRLSAFGGLWSAVAGLAMADIARSPTVPGANDNLSACGALVAVAEALRADPEPGLRVLLVSCGAEEVLQGGVHDFAARWFDRLDPESTAFLALDTVGSPMLLLAEGEGPFRMQDYARPEFRDLVAGVAEKQGIALRRGMRARASTDAVVPSRAGFATALLASMNEHKALSNYHLMSDTPENLDYATVTNATALAEAVARAWARSA